jgi:ketosteroid isomerase-like protein
MQQTDINNEALQPRSTATPFSAFFWPSVSGDVATAADQLADDVEWHLMPYNHAIKGKEAVIPWLKAGGASQKEPVIINNVATKEWGVCELWNIGTLTADTVEYGKQLGWPLPRDTNSLIGRKYKVAQCFVYHINAEGKIDVIRQYMDAGTVWAQISDEIKRRPR